MKCLRPGLLLLLASAMLHALSQIKCVSWQLESTLCLQAGMRTWTVES